MATFKTEASVGNKEDLASFISMITRDETPFASSIGNTKAKAVFHEWQTDELAAPGANAQSEGADYSNTTTLAATVRLGNYTQILAKEIKVSKTLDSISKAGRASEFAYQMKKKGTELKRDLEHALVGARQVSNGTGGQTSANAGRTMGGVQSWINGSSTFDQETGAMLTGTADGTSVAAAGTADGAFSLSAVDEVMQKIYEEGGKAGTLMMGPSIKRAFSAAAVGTTDVRRNINDSGKLRQSVEIYESDFGAVKVVPNYVMGLGDGVSDIIAYDSANWSLATLRPLHNTDVGQKGDSTVGMMVEEVTLQCKNPAGNGLIVNVA